MSTISSPYKLVNWGAMEATVDSVIASLRQVVGVRTDADLARQLDLDKSALAAWRARGRVPPRYQRFLEEMQRGSISKDLSVWPDLHSAAHRIALVRITLIRYDVACSGNVDQAMSVFQSLHPFWLIMHRAAHDIRIKMTALGADIRTAQALVMQEDLRDHIATASRVSAALSEDLADNPTLPIVD